MKPWRNSFPNLQCPSVYCGSDIISCIITSFAELSVGVKVGRGPQDCHCWASVCVSGAGGPGFPLVTADVLCIPSAQWERINICCSKKKKKKNIDTHISYSGHHCFTRFNSVAFFCLYRDLWHFTLPPWEIVDKLTELWTETLMRLSTKCHKAQDALSLRHGFGEKYANVLTVKAPLSE